jgi:hypothetical protein
MLGASQDIVIKVQNVWPSSLLPAELHAKSRFLEASPKNLLCVVTKLAEWS